MDLYPTAATRKDITFPKYYQYIQHFLVELIEQAATIKQQPQCERLKNLLEMSFIAKQNNLVDRKAFRKHKS